MKPACPKCEVLVRQLWEVEARRNVRRPVEDEVVNREIAHLRRLYEQWNNGRKTRCFCEFVSKRHGGWRGD